MIAAILAGCWNIRRKQRLQKSQPVIAERTYNSEPPSKNYKGEPQTAGNGGNFLGPTTLQELESPSPSRTGGNTKALTTMAEMG
jgi:hypothetical protein